MVMELVISVGKNNMRYSKHIMVRLSEEQKIKIEKISKKNNKTIGEIIRSFIETLST